MDLFKKQDISDEALGTLDLESIQICLGDRGRLVTCSFYNSLSLWKRENQVVAADVPVSAPNGFKKFNGQLDIHKILTADLEGQQAIAYFNTNKKLSEASRRKVIRVIVNYLIQFKIWVEKKKFPIVTNYILDYFKTDNPHEVVSIENVFSIIYFHKLDYVFDFGLGNNFKSPNTKLKFAYEETVDFSKMNLPVKFVCAYDTESNKHQHNIVFMEIFHKFGVMASLLSFSAAKSAVIYQMLN